jgi:hypothetical protein
MCRGITGKARGDGRCPLKEVAITSRIKIPICQFRQQAKTYTPVANAGNIYDWKWPEIKKILFF